MTEITGLATGIGSLPHLNADSALDLIFKHVPHMPFWPQLPKRSPLEGMVAQFSEGMPCIRVNGSGVSIDTRDRERELERFYEKTISQDLEYFKITDIYAAGLYGFLNRLNAFSAGFSFIKLHTTGPFTFAAGITDEAGVCVLHDKIMMQAYLEGLRMKALWQIRLFKRFNKKILFFIDEPYLSCFGSAYTPVNREDIVLALNDFTAGLKSEGVTIGLHCCGNTDWSLFTGCEGIGLISFDAFSFLEKFTLYAEDIRGFLDRGGIISWGVVPTQSFAAPQSTDLFTGKILSGIEALGRKGLDKFLLRERMIVTPACGLGTFTEDNAQKVFKALSDVSEFIRRGFK